MAVEPTGKDAQPDSGTFTDSVRRQDDAAKPIALDVTDTTAPPAAAPIKTRKLRRQVVLTLLIALLAGAAIWNAIQFRNRRSTEEDIAVLQRSLSQRDAQLAGLQTKLSNANTQVAALRSEVEAYRNQMKSVREGLLGIRTQLAGIERLTVVAATDSATDATVVARDQAPEPATKDETAKTSPQSSGAPPPPDVRERPATATPSPTAEETTRITTEESPSEDAPYAESPSVSTDGGSLSLLDRIRRAAHRAATSIRSWFSTSG